MHNMTTRQEGQVALYDETEDTSNTHKITALPTTPSSKSIVDLDGETTAEYSKETTTQRDLTKLQEHFEQLQEKLNQLGTATNTPVHTKELANLANKLQKIGLHPESTLYRQTCG